MCFFVVFFFFFKQKTAYEMRISDWSSDVCSSDLDCAARRGLIVSFGSASGPVEGVALGTLASKGSLFVTRPTLFDYVVTRDERQQVIDRVFAMLAGGAITAGTGPSVRWESSAEADRLLQPGTTESRHGLRPWRG